MNDAPGDDVHDDAAATAAGAARAPAQPDEPPPDEPPPGQPPGEPTSAKPEPSPRGPGLAGVVATITGNVYLVFGTLFFAVLTCLTGWIPLPGGSRMFFVWARTWSKLLLLTSGVRMRVEHLQPLDRRRTYVFLSNHQSLFDIPVVLATLPMPARFLAKKELFKIPIFGWSLRVGGFIPVDRGARSAGESFRAAAERLKTGGSVLLFPEETRSLDGRLLPFKRGGFLLAQKASLPLVPVGIGGTLGVRPKNTLLIHPRTVTVRYGEPIESRGVRPEGGSLLQVVRKRIAELAGVEAPPQPVKGDTP